MAGSPVSICEDLSCWLEDAASGLDAEPQAAPDLLPRLAAAGLLGLGVPRASGGQGADLCAALDAISAVSFHSLAAGFMFWGHRSYMELLVQSSNTALAARILPDLLAGRVAGAVGLSNAMKFLAGFEGLQVVGRAEGPDLILDGLLPWVTNLRPEGFHVAVALAGPPDCGLVVASLAQDDPGLERSRDLDLMGLKATHTAALTLSGVRLPPDRILSREAAVWLAQVRPSFLGLQCGMSIGLARRALAEARALVTRGSHILSEPLARAEAALTRQDHALKEGLRSGAFKTQPAALFAIRIALAACVDEAVTLELQAKGGQAYLAGPGAGFARRWREAAFIPVITPSLVQLKSVLAAAQQSAA